MEDEYVHDNPQDPAEERFVRLEEKVTNISRNMALLITTLSNNLGPFREAKGSNLEISSEGKLGDNEDPKKESRKDPEKEKPISSAITPS
jgi:hypothetical protein